ncbi:MAG: nitroreductase family protein [Acidimicrobiales bacterium]
MIIMMNSAAVGFDLDVVDHLLTTTRAVRKRIDLSRPVEPEVIETCLRLACQAPSGGNGQRWRWVVVADPRKKEIVAERYAESFARYIAPRKAQLRPDDERGHRMVDSATYLADHMAEMPLLVIPCTLDQLAPDADAEQRAGLYGGIFPAVWSFQLALRSRGLGSALTTLHLAHEREVGEALGIPETVSQVALLPVGYHTGDDFKVAPRRSAEELTYWDSWKGVR